MKLIENKMKEINQLVSKKSIQSIKRNKTKKIMMNINKLTKQ